MTCTAFGIDQVSKWFEISPLGTSKNSLTIKASHRVDKGIKDHRHKKRISWDFLDDPVLKTSFPRQGVWVRSPVGELRSHMPCSQKNKT